MAIFAPIHIKSGYSFLQSGLTIDKIVSSLKKNDYYGAALADLNCLYGVHEFTDELAKINKPCCIGMDDMINNPHPQLTFHLHFQSCLVTRQHLYLSV